MDHARSQRTVRLVLGAAVGLAGVIYTRASLDVFNTTKLTVLAVAGVAIVAVVLWRALATRRVSLPASPFTVAVGAFVLVLVPAALAADRLGPALVGDVGRHTGALPYLLYAVLALVAVGACAGTRGDAIAVPLVVAAGPVLVYAALQAVGADPRDWNLVEGGPPVFSTFGNANFFSAWVGIVAVIALAGALRHDWPVPARWPAVAVALGGVVLGAASRSLQGPAAALAGMALVGGVWLWSGPLAAQRVKVGAAVGALVVAGAGAVAAGIGPLAGMRAMAARSLETRVGKWEAGWAMLGDHPLRGVGMDAYGDHFHAYRSADLAAESGLVRTTDAPHMVVLDLLVSGGWPLGLAWLAVTATVAWALVAGLARLDGTDRLALAGLGGAWVAYQVQALVSLDVPALAGLGWVLGGAIVGIATTPDRWTWVLPGAPTADRRGRIRPARVPVPATAVLAVIALGATWVVTTPLRADLAASGGPRAPSPTVEQLERAGEIAWWDHSYLVHRGETLARNGAIDDAVAIFGQAQERRPRDLAAAINRANAAAAADDVATADAAWEVALQLDPLTPDLHVMVGRWELEQGRDEAALDHLEQAIGARSDRADWWVSLGQARSVNDDDDGAREAFERALSLDADADGAREGLDQLS